MPPVTGIGGHEQYPESTCFDGGRSAGRLRCALHCRTTGPDQGGLGAHVDQTVHGSRLAVPDEQAIRDLHAQNKSFAAILETCLFLDLPDAKAFSIDPQHILATVLGIDDDWIDKTLFSAEEEAHLLRYVDLDLFDGDRESALRMQKREWLINHVLHPYQERMNVLVRRHLDENGPFMPGAIEMLHTLTKLDCRIKIIDIPDLKSGFSCDVAAALRTRINLPKDAIVTRGLRGLEGKDVKDLFPDLEHLREQDIMVCTNHTGLLARSTGLDFSNIDSLHAEFFDRARPGGPGWSRLKDKPYHVCMTGYNKSTGPDYMPSTVRSGQILIARNFAELVRHARFFAAGSLGRSFSPAQTKTVSGPGATILKFKKK